MVCFILRLLQRITVVSETNLSNVAEKGKEKHNWTDAKQKEGVSLRGMRRCTHLWIFPYALWNYNLCNQFVANTFASARTATCQFNIQRREQTNFSLPIPHNLRDQVQFPTLGSMLCADTYSYTLWVLCTNGYYGIVARVQSWWYAEGSRNENVECTKHK